MIALAHEGVIEVEYRCCAIFFDRNRYRCTRWSECLPGRDSAPPLLFQQSLTDQEEKVGRCMEESGKAASPIGIELLNLGE